MSNEQRIRHASKDVAYYCPRDESANCGGQTTSNVQGRLWCDRRRRSLRERLPSKLCVCADSPQARLRSLRLLPMQRRVHVTHRFDFDSNRPTMQHGTPSPSTTMLKSSGSGPIRRMYQMCEGGWPCRASCQPGREPRAHWPIRLSPNVQTRKFAWLGRLAVA